MHLFVPKKMNCLSGFSRIINGICLLAAAFYFMSPAETVPVGSWKKVLPSTCYFAASAGDSIICIGTSIYILSQDGTLLSQSAPLDETKNISARLPAFYLTKDKSIVVIPYGCTVKKITLDNEIIWLKSLCDSIPGACITGFTEDAGGNMYLCGRNGNQAGLIFKIGDDGSSVSKQNSSFPGFFSIVYFADSLFVTSSTSENPYYASRLGKFDTKGNFVKQIIDSGCAPPMILDGGHIFALNRKEGAPLLKRTFFSTSDIFLKKFSMSGRIDTIAMFDFGKWEYPMSIQKYQDGLLMITQSNETVNLGTSIMNYFITKLDASLSTQWQLHFGTDMDDTIHSRYFSADDQGTILATHNDTLFKFKDASTDTRKIPFTTRDGHRIFPDGGAKVFDCQGRRLFDCPTGTGLNANCLKRSGSASGLKLMRSGNRSMQIEIH